jgi:hypothetical protein
MLSVFQRRNGRYIVDAECDNDGLAGAGGTANPLGRQPSGPDTEINLPGILSGWISGRRRNDCVVVRAVWRLVGSITTLAIMLLFWPVISALFNRAGELVRLSRSEA